MPATDKAPLPGDFKNLSQGVASLGELAVTFTALSHADPLAAKQDMLSIVGSVHATAAQ